MKNKLIKWISKRIIELQADYDEAQTASYGTGLAYDSGAKQRMIAKGGKMRGFKEVKEYVESHLQETLNFEIEHCGHCALRSSTDRGERCYIIQVKDVEEEVREKKMHEECPLRKCSIVFKQKMK